MTGTERRLREAFDSAADTIDPDSLKPLVLPTRGRGWLVPSLVAGALAVTLVGGAVAGGQIFHTSSPSSPALAGGQERLIAIHNGRAVVEDGAGRVIARIPGRYAAVAAAVPASPAPSPSAYVTDEALSSIPAASSAPSAGAYPPSSTMTFSATPGPAGKPDPVSSDGRVFFLAAETSTDTYAFFRVTLDDPSVPKPVPGGTVRSSTMAGGPNQFTVSGDGSKLAVVGNPGDRAEAVVVDVRTGAHRTWTAPGERPITSATWSPDNRTLGFIWPEKDGEPGLRALDTGGASSDLASARLIGKATLPSNALVNAFTYDPDGRTVTAAVQGEKRGGDDATEYTMTRLDARTGKPTGWKVVLPTDSFSFRPDTSGGHFLHVIDGRLGRVDGGVFSWVTRYSNYEDAAW
ncbi:hypothetical protein [Actinomadura terrae]|uniref:hypothetical protein n=1 Tax=Actinomadura terrae TaxID=604353 RepID=UPI001FA7318A|nr:hypothetical protein [Actinomadura terrae]